jgi:hypothetical protein
MHPTRMLSSALLALLALVCGTPVYAQTPSPLPPVVPNAPQQNNPNQERLGPFAHTRSSILETSSPRTTASRLAEPDPGTAIGSKRAPRLRHSLRFSTGARQQPAEQRFILQH